MFSVIYAVLLLLLSPTTKASAAAPATATGGRNCTTSCGSIGIQYPFGVEPGCYRDEGFKLTCTNDSSLFVGYGTEVLEIDLANGTMLINVQRVDQSNLSLPDPRSSSNNDYLTGTWAVIGQGDLGPYVLSDTRNKLVVVGCDVQVLLMALDDDDILSTCAAFCSPVKENLYLVASPDCSGVGCCQATIPTGLAIYLLQFRRFNGSWSGHQAKVYIADAERLSSYRMDGQLPWALPAVAEWVISNTACPGNMTSPECLSSHSFCQNSTTFGSGHRCHCSAGYDGNPYVFNGCNGT
jgi:hypothetical protein